MEEKSTLGNFIRKKRKELNLSQKELAVRLYVTESAVSKWERGISYPDITLVAGICQALSISEHELITASEDFQQVELEKQAKGFKNIQMVYSNVLYGIYGISLTACFIVNIAVNNGLSWFFIVLAAEIAAFTLLNLPVILKKNKMPVILGAFFASLNLLLLVCCIYTGGTWFWVTFVSLLSAFCVVFLPMLLKGIGLPGAIARHKAVLCLLADSVLLFLLVIAAAEYTGYNRVMSAAIPIAALGLILPWLFCLVIRYLPFNGLYKSSICILAVGFYQYGINGIINVILKGDAFRLPEFNFTNWRDPYINGNISLLIFLSSILTAVLFTAGGILLTLKKRKTEKMDEKQDSYK